MFAAASLISFSLYTQAGDWPQWHGPNRDGISTETGWATTWPKEGLKQAWKAEIGAGYGTVSVSKGRLYAMGNTGDQDSVYCLDANTGKQIWLHTYACPAKDPNGYHGVRSTPTVDGDKVFVTSRKGHLFCLNAADGAVKWSKEFPKDFGGKVPTWGYALSPVVEGPLLIVEPGGPGASMAALNKETGEVVWKAGDEPAAYSSPVVFDFKGSRCVVVLTAKGPVGRGVKDGAELFRYPWKTSYDVNAATPLIDGNKIFISSGYNTGCALVDAAGNPPKEIWKNKNMRNHVNSCVLWKGYIYGFDEGELKCLDEATGEVKWAEGKYGKGSVSVADGKLLLYSEKGELGLATPSPEGYKELAFVPALTVRDKYPGGAQKQTWAVPVLANGKIYCRSQDDLVCLDVSGK